MFVQPLEARCLFAVTISGLTATITGTAGDDQIHIVRGDGVIVANVNGQATPLPGVVEALVQGLGGNDSLSADEKLLLWVTLDGNAGNDTLVGGGGNDVLRGGDGNDQLHDSGGDDALLGQAGDDLLIADFEPNNAATHVYRDYLDGGSGRDTLDFSRPILLKHARPFFRPVISRVDEGAGPRSVFGGAVFGIGVDHTIANYETIRATHVGDDIKLIVQDPLPDDFAAAKSLHFETLDGDDEITTVANNGAFFGPLNLAIDTGEGNDRFAGDPVHSMISASMGSGHDSVALPAFVTPRLRFGKGRDLFTVVDGGFFPGQRYTMPDDLEAFVGHNVAEVVGNAYDNVITSIDGKTVSGGGGNDQITATLVDFVDGGAGNDTIRTVTGSRDTTVFGGAGDDVLVGGRRLFGDAGNDRLIDTGSAFSLNGGTGNDRYTLGENPIAFVIARDGERDRIDLGTLDRDSILSKLKADRTDLITGGR